MIERQFRQKSRLINFEEFCQVDVICKVWYANIIFKSNVFNISSSLI